MKKTILVDNCDGWVFEYSTSVLFSDEFIYQTSRSFRNDIVKFLDENF